MITDKGFNIMADLKITRLEKREHTGVLVVHDRKDLDILFSISLSLMGLKMYSTSNPLDAMQTFLSKHLNTIFADPNIPGVITLIRQIKEDSSDFPRIVLIFGPQDEKVAGLIKPKNVDEILIRPFGPVDIRNAVERIGEKSACNDNRLYQDFGRDNPKNKIMNFPSVQFRAQPATSS